MNAQDIDIYVILEEGIYLYNAVNNSLDPLIAGNYFDLPGKTDAPVNLLLISDISRFRAGNDSIKLSWAKMDAGIVSQNIGIFCAATGLKTRPRASFPDLEKLRQVLELRSTQFILLIHPVGYGKE
jgi:nitroreductase